MRSLYTRIFLSFWAAMALIVGGSITLTWFVLAERADDVPRQSAELVLGAERALAEGGRDGLRAWLEAAHPRGHEPRLLIMDENGDELLGRPLPPHFARMLKSPRVLPAYPGIEVVPSSPLPQIIAPDGHRFEFLVLPLRHGGGPFFGITETRAAVLLLALVITGAASWLLARSITRPVRALGEATRDLAAGNLAARVAGDVSARRDELGTLGRDFNAMATRLRQLLDAREQLLRDVSHELRSPLARMRLSVGLARQPGSDPVRELDRLEGEIERLDRLIGQVLHLSRIEATASAELDESVDLVDVLDGIARDAAFEGQAVGVSIDWQPPPGTMRVRGNAAWLASAIENVARNAVRYTASGTSVAFGVREQADGIEVRIRDHGPGVPEAELAKIFEPFHRVAESRTRDTGGDGIGLAITARVLQAHGGSVTAENAPGGGLLVTMRLPRAAA